MQLPNADKAVVDQKKIQEYLLSTTHPDGWSKAQFFLGIGFEAEKWHVFAVSLRRHGQDNSVTDVVESAYGIRYTVDGDLKSPSGHRVRVRTVWIVEKDRKIPRLITAYPL